MNFNFIGFQMDGGVRTAAVRVVDHKPKPKVFASVRSAQENLSGQNLALMAAQIGGKGVPWVLVLNRGDYQFSRVNKPDVPDHELAQSLRWLVPLKDVDPQDANISWVSVPQAPGKPRQLYVAACSQALVNAVAGLFRSVKLELGAVDIREMPQRNIASRIGKNGVICLLVPESNGIQLTLTQGSELYLDRFIRESLSEPALIDEACLKRIGIEIRRSLEFVRSAYPDLPAAEIYLGPMPVNFDLRSKLSEELGQSVKNLDLSTIFDWPANSPLADTRVQADFFPLLGACLRPQS